MIFLLFLLQLYDSSVSMALASNCRDLYYGDGVFAPGEYVVETATGHQVDVKCNLAGTILL